MKLNDISIIDPEDRVIDIGEYNGYVSICPFCYPEHIWLENNHIVGFGSDNKGFVVQVDECPKCFQKSHHHIDTEIYKLFQIIKNK